MITSYNNYNYNSTTSNETYITPTQFYVYYDDCDYDYEDPEHLIDNGPDYDIRTWLFKKYQEDNLKQKKFKLVNNLSLCYHEMKLKLIDSRSGYKGFSRLKREGRI